MILFFICFHFFSIAPHSSIKKSFKNKYSINRLTQKFTLFKKTILNPSPVHNQKDKTQHTHLIDLQPTTHETQHNLLNETIFLQPSPSCSMTIKETLIYLASSQNDVLRTVIQKVQQALCQKLKHIYFNDRLYPFSILSNLEHTNLVVQIDNAVIVDDSRITHLKYLPHRVQYPDELLSICHPFLNIPVLVQKCSNNHTYLLSSFILGQPLHLCLIRQLSETLQKRIFLSLLLALEELSFNNFFHNDLFPDNVIVSNQHTALLIDFELSDTCPTLYYDWARLRNILEFRFQHCRWKEKLYTDLLIDYKRCENEDKDLTAFNLKLQQLCLWNGWTDELKELLPSLPQTQIHRLFSNTLAPVQCRQILLFDTTHLSA